MAIATLTIDTTKNLGLLLGDFSAAKASDKLKLVGPMTVKAMEDCQNPNSGLPMRMLQIFTGVLGSDNEMLTTQVVEGLVQVSARMVSARNDYTALKFVFHTLLDTAEKTKNPSYTKLLHAKAFELATFINSDEALPLVYDRFNRAAFSDKEHYFDFLSKKAAIECAEPESEWPEKIAGVFLENIQQENVSKIAATDSLYKLALAM